MMYPRRLSPLALLAGTPLVGCHSAGGDSSDLVCTGVPIVITDTADPADTGQPPWVTAGLQGHVQVQLQTPDEGGEITDVAWQDSCFGEHFPYGSIWIAAYRRDADGAVIPLADTWIPYPSQDSASNAWSMEISVQGASALDEVWVTAVLDKWQERVLTDQDSLASWAQPLSLQEGVVTQDVDITLPTPLWCGYDEGACPDCPAWMGLGAAFWRWEDDTWVNDGWTDCGAVVDISGTLTIDEPAGVSGSAAILGMEQGSQSVLWLDGVEVTETPGPAPSESAYSLSVCADSGTFGFRAVWDSNGNTLFDPFDLWGAPLDAGGAALDTLTIGDEDLCDQAFAVPVEGAALDIGL